MGVQVGTLQGVGTPRVDNDGIQGDMEIQIRSTKVVVNIGVLMTKIVGGLFPKGDGMGGTLQINFLQVVERDKRVVREKVRGFHSPSRSHRGV